MIMSIAHCCCNNFVAADVECVRVCVHLELELKLEIGQGVCHVGFYQNNLFVACTLYNILSGI